MVSAVSFAKYTRRAELVSADAPVVRAAHCIALLVTLTLEDDAIECTLDAGRFLRRGEHSNAAPKRGQRLPAYKRPERAEER